MRCCLELAGIVGVDPTRLTLRELNVMATSRQQSDWLKVGVGVAWIVNKNGWTKEPLDPMAIIPEPYRPDWAKQPRELGDEERAVEHDDAMRMLDAYFIKQANGEI